MSRLFNVEVSIKVSKEVNMEDSSEVSTLVREDTGKDKCFRCQAIKQSIDKLVRIVS